MAVSMHNPGIRSRVDFGLAGLVIVCSVAAWLIGDHKAAGIIAGQACIALCLIYTAAKRNKKTM